MGNFLTALNTSYYQPDLNCCNYSSSYTNGLYSSNYSNYSSQSIFQGQGFNNNNCWSPMAPQYFPQDNSTGFMQQLVMMLLSEVLNRQNNDATTTVSDSIYGDTAANTSNNGHVNLAEAGWNAGNKIIPGVGGVALGLAGGAAGLVVDPLEGAVNGIADGWNKGNDVVPVVGGVVGAAVEGVAGAVGGVVDAIGDLFSGG